MFPDVLVSELSRQKYSSSSNYTDIKMNIFVSRASSSLVQLDSGQLENMEIKKKNIQILNDSRLKIH